jgi:drug/metabolite transporter (DMT)-like permease
VGVAPAFAAALAASAILSLGMVLQKRHVLFVGFQGPRDAAFRRARRGWLAGFTLVNLAPPFNYLALLGLPANVVAGVSGSNVAFAALFSALLLGERIGLRELLLSLALFGAIAVACLRGGAASMTTDPAAPPELLFAWLFILVPIVLAVAAAILRKRWKGPLLAVLIGALSGAMGGFMLIPLKLLGGAEPRIAAWLAAPWLWLYLAAGIASFAFVQLAYKDGEMKRVAPAFYGLQVLWPAIASLFVFSQSFDPLQWVAFAVIGACVALMAGGKERV